MSDTVFAALSWDILAVWLPVAATAAVALCSAVLIRRDRYRRKLALLPSPEAERIRSLAAGGALRPEEAEKLLAECNALPEVRERSPLPDLPLKLVSVSGRIYSTMKFVMLPGTAAAFYVLHLCAASPGFRGSYEFHGEKLPLFAAAAGAVLLLALFEFIASVKILHGSIAARNFLIFSWIVNFALVRAMLSPFDSPLYFIPTAACGAYALYVLLLRRGAVRKIAAGRPETGRGAKAGAALLAAAALAFGLCAFSARSNSLYERFATASNFSSATSDGANYARFEKLLLIQGTPDGETLKLCELLAAGLKADPGTVCEIRRFGGPVPTDDLLRTLPVLVTRETYTPPAPLPGIIRKHLPDSLFPAGPAPDREDTLRGLAGKMKRNFCFRVETITGAGSSSFFYKGLQLTDGAVSFSGTFLAGTSNPEMADRSIGRVAGMAVKALNSLWEKRRATSGIRLPEIRLPEPEPAGLDFSAFSGVERIFTGRSPQYGVLAAFRFELPENRDGFERLVASLEKQGFRRPESYAGIGRFNLKKGDGRTIGGDVLVTLCVPEENAVTGTLNSRRPHGLLLYSSGKALKNAETPDLEFLKRFAESDLRSFALAGGLRFLPEPEMRKAFGKLLATEPLNRREKLHLFGRVSGGKARRALGPAYDAFFRQLAEEILADFADPGCMGAVESLLFYTGEAPEQQEFLLTRLAPIRETLRLPETPGPDGLHTLKSLIRRSPLLPSRLLLDIEIPGRPPLRVAAALTGLPDGTFKVEMSGMSHSGLSREELGRYKCDISHIILSRSGGEWMSGWSSNGPRHSGREESILPDRPRPGEAVIRLQPDEAASGYLIGIAWNPDKK